MEIKNLSITKMYVLLSHCVYDSVPFRFDIYERPDFYQLNIYLSGKMFYHSFSDRSYKEYLRLFKYAFRAEAKVLRDTQSDSDVFF